VRGEGERKRICAKRKEERVRERYFLRVGSRDAECMQESERI